MTTRFASVLTLALATFASALGLWAASDLQIDARLSALLPEAMNARANRDARVVHDRARLEPTFRVLAEGAPRDAREGASRVADALREWPGARWVSGDGGIEALRDGRLLYLELEQVHELTEQVSRRLEWERCEAMPGCVSLEDRPELPTEAELAETLERTDAGQLLMAGAGEGAGDDARCSSDGRVCIVEAALEASASDVNAAAAVVADARDLFADVQRDLRAEGFGPVAFEVTGAYRNAPIVRATAASDLRTTGAITLVALLLLGVLALRGPRGVLLVFAPLSVAMAVTAGLVAAYGAPLNLISAFTFALVAGVGIDFGFHLLTDYAARRPAQSVRQAATTAVRELRRPMGVAALTTAAAFLALVFTAFVGFRQTGWIAALGVALTYVSYRMLFVPCAVALDALAAERRPLLRDLRLPRPGRIFRAVAVVLACASLAVLSVRGPSFETNFRRLRPAAAFNSIEARDAFGAERGTPVIVAADSAAELAEARAALRGLRWIGPNVVLPNEQLAKLDAFAQLRTELEEANAMAELRAALPRRALTPRDLPPRLRDVLVERDGTFGRMAIAYAPASGADAQAMELLHADLNRARAQTDARFHAPSAALGVIMPMLRSDSLQIAVLAFVALLMVVALVTRDGRRTTLVVASVLLSAALTAALMAIFDLRLNIYNVLVVPIAFGVGVDGAVYMSEGRRTSLGVLLGGLTSLAAFGSLAFAESPGIRSIGTLACVALSVALFVNLWLLPAALPRTPQVRAKPSRFHPPTPALPP
ncbi:MAG: MMPL family transporter [Myxococcota bacterium]